MISYETKAVRVVAEVGAWGHTVAGGISYVGQSGVKPGSSSKLQGVRHDESPPWHIYSSQWGYVLPVD